MAHHIGMSILASCNALYDNIMQKRFMNSRNMLAAKELLEEKIPAGAAVFDDIVEPEVPQKPGRMSGEAEIIDDINLSLIHIYKSVGHFSLKLNTNCAYKSEIVAHSDLIISKHC